MMTTRIRSMEVVLTVYIALGIAIIHMTPWDVVFAVCCGLLNLGILGYNGTTAQRTHQYDSWGWSKTATKAVLVSAITISVGGIPFIEKILYPLFVLNESVVMPFWTIVALVFFGIMMGVVVFLRGYFEPIYDKTLDRQSLELEHRECLTLLSILGIFAGIFFIGAGYPYLSALLGVGELIVSPHLSMITLLPFVQFFYVAAGYVLWVLRPIYGRGKEIRDHIIQLREIENSLKATKRRK